MRKFNQNVTQYTLLVGRIHDEVNHPLSLGLWPSKEMSR